MKSSKEIPNPEPRHHDARAHTQKGAPFPEWPRQWKLFGALVLTGLLIRPAGHWPPIASCLPPDFPNR